MSLLMEQAIANEGLFYRLLYLPSRTCVRSGFSALSMSKLTATITPTAVGS